MTDEELRGLVTWHARYERSYDEDPWAYLRNGILPSGRSRRLGVLIERRTRLRAYLGIQHFDPALWGNRGQAYCKFFLSLRAPGRGVSLRTNGAMDEALGMLRQVYETLLSAQKGATGAAS